MSGIRAWVSVADDGPVSPETAMEVVTDALRPFKGPGYPIAVQYGTFTEAEEPDTPTLPPDFDSRMEDLAAEAQEQQKRHEDRLPSPAEAARARALLFEIAEDGDASAEARCWAAASILGVSFQ